MQPSAKCLILRTTKTKYPAFECATQGNDPAFEGAKCLILSITKTKVTESRETLMTGKTM